MNAALLLIGLLLGVAVAGGYALRTRAHLEQTRAGADAAAAEREARLRVELAEARANQATDEQMLDAFRSVSADALAGQSQQLVQLAEAKYGTLQQNTDTVLHSHSKTVGDGLSQLAERLTALERERASSAVELRTMVSELVLVTAATKEEAAKLASAMSDNRVRGAWGEVQLRRALELAGLTRHVDFTEQGGIANDSGSGRPDVVVRLANGHSVVIDSKVPLNRYLEAVDATDPTAERALQVEHAKCVAAHAKSLAGRDYASMLEGSIDLVLLFLPGEPFLSAALDAHPALFEAAAAQGVYLVTPSSLVPLLRGIALGWREHQAEQAAAEIHQLGVELHERICVFAEHHAKVGKQLTSTVEAYNKSVGSLETRVLSTARKLSDRGAISTRELPNADSIETIPRKLQLVSGDTDEATPVTAVDAPPA